MLGHILMTAVNAVAPIVLLIALGYLLRRSGFLNASFLKLGNKLVFNVFLPAMLFVNIYAIPSIGDVRWDIILYCVVMVTILFAIGWVLGVITTKDPGRRGVIWQCAFRSNFAIIGLPLAQALGGDGGAAVAAVLSAFTIPAYNAYSVIALSVYTGKKKKASEVVKNILKNPLTLAVLAGLGALLIRTFQELAFGSVVFSLQRDTEFLYTTLSNLKAATTPLALIVLGGQCEFSMVKGMLKEISVATVGRVVLAPALAICGALVCSALGLFPVGNGELAALIALFGSPVAVSSAIMAGNMDGDKQLATLLVVWTSILSVATIFLTVCILMGTGFLVV